MTKEKWMSAAALAVLLTAATSCDNWGRKDPPAGNQVKPTLENVATYDFEAEEGLDPTVFKGVANPGGSAPSIVADEIKGKVLRLDNGYISLTNPLNQVTLQEAASFTFWMMQPVVNVTDADGNESALPQNLNGPILTFENETGNGRLVINPNGGFSYKAADGDLVENDPAVATTGYLTQGVWHYVAIILNDEGYEWWVDGDRKVSKEITNFDCSKIVKFVNNVPVMTIGASDNNGLLLLDDLKVYRNVITEKEIKRPNLGGGGTGPGGPVVGPTTTPVEPVYFNSFDAGLNGATIMGGGEIKYVGGAYGSVFSNAMDGMRQNYLLLPEDALSHSADTEALTIAVWVNRGNESVSSHYMWSPLFTAYGGEPNPDNTWPMLACQYRGVLQVNNEGWSDYTDDQNVNGVNGVYHDATDWLADGKWHYYTATFTPTTAKVYFDGVIVNEWEIDGVNNTAAGMFAHGDAFKHICLGGNQAWNWGDPDPGFWFDDLAIYNTELSAAQIKSIMGLKTNMIYGNTFSNNEGDATKMGAGEFIENATPGFGKIFKNAVGGMRENYLLLPSDALSGIGSTEELTVSVWLNSTDAGDYFWNPVFTAFAESPGGNGCPMFALQYRGVLSVNCNGPDNAGDNWCDYAPEQSDTGEVILYHGDLDWLKDQKWHLYTAVVTPTTAKIYFDGEIANAWTLDGESRGQQCDLKTVATLSCICLGGNQAWGWGDPDPGFGFDDIFIFNKALSQDEVKQLMLLKK
ncbi:MAG: LamG domain-containing protein [Muribaculaceae bacterium]|nr:LamG domain-containing protein [Muribaculaceae bacterium]